MIRFFSHKYDLLSQNLYKDILSNLFLPTSKFIHLFLTCSIHTNQHVGCKVPNWAWYQMEGFLHLSDSPNHKRYTSSARHRI